MRIRILFFASYRDLVGTGDLEMDLAEGSDVSALVAEVTSLGGGFHALPRHPVVAVNQEYAVGDRVLQDGDEVAFIPPVAGG
jgi:molybdopterin converting factor subunit 1